MPEQTVVRSRKGSYIGVGIMLGSVVLLAISAAVYAESKGDRENGAKLLEAAALMAAFLAFSWWNINTFKLILTEDSIVWKELWHSTEVPVGAVRSITHARSYGLVPIWLIHCTDHSTVLVKISNFTPDDLRRFAQLLLKRNPGIHFAALPPGALKDDFQPHHRA